jgi:hypothetical protein
VSRESGRGTLSSGFCIFFALSVLLVSGAGCLWGGTKKGPPPLPPESQDSLAPGSAATTSSPGAEERHEETGIAGGSPVGVEAVAAQESAPPSSFAKGAPLAESGEPAPKPRPPGAAPPAGGKIFTDPPTEVPSWASGKEVLVYRVEFLGLTMGYARFTFNGKVSLHGRETYHLNVRAWTSDFLSVIYPINDNIDYYLDVKTLAPLRQEFTHIGKGKDDVAIYDQENGKIVYRYKDTGEIRKQVDVPPDTYDPVSVAYYFRTRDLGAEDRPRHVFGGRKMWEISSRLLGQERINTSGGPVDTVVIQPVIKREGQLENKGDLRMWMTNDARHVPVRLYAKFRKIKDWTLVAELMPPREGG